jgi:hypothetical protein
MWRAASSPASADSSVAAKRWARASRGSRSVSQGIALEFARVSTTAPGVSAAFGMSAPAIPGASAAANASTLDAAVGGIERRFPGTRRTRSGEPSRSSTGRS